MYDYQESYAFGYNDGFLGHVPNSRKCNHMGYWDGFWQGKSDAMYSYEPVSLA